MTEPQAMAAPGIGTVSPHGRSLARMALQRFLHHRLAIFGAVVLTVLIALTLLAPLIGPYSHTELNLRNRLSPPNPEHWLGTDGTGRDTMARLLMGGRVSLAVGFVAVAIATTIGIVFGSVAGFFGGFVESAIMRFTDLVMSIPPLVAIIALVAALGPNMRNTMLAIGLLGWPAIARLVRGEVLSARTMEYVTSAKSLGGSSWRIIARHILPNIISSVLVAATLFMSSAILMEAGLSFLGLGVQPPTPSWGNMLQQAQSFTMLERAPWLWIPPGLAIVVTVLSINFIGDGLSDALNPRQRSYGKR
jgi:peptide/nickel transport system permease protein